MKRIIFFIFVLLFTQLAFSQSVSIELSEDYVEVFSDKFYVVELTIKNYQAKGDTFQINIIPSLLGKVSAFSVPSTLFIKANSSSKVRVYFHAQADAEQSVSPLIFKLIVTSLSDPSIKESKEIKVMVKRKAPLYISDFKIDKTVFNPGETVKLKITVFNTADKPSEDYVLQAVIIKENVVIKTFEASITNIPGKSSKDYVFEYASGKYAPYSTYTVKVELKKDDTLLYEKTSQFKIRAVAKIPTQYSEKKTEVKLLAVYVTIKVKNEGNIGTGDFYITETIPLIAKDFFEPEIKPVEERIVGDSVVYKWLIPSLEPGEEIEIKYQFVLWKVYVALGIIVVAVYIAFRYAFGVSLIKIHPYSIKRNEDATINIEIKNKGLGEIRDVYVRDFVPSTLKVFSKFGTVKPDSIKKREKGIELIWKFDSLKGREERVLVYKVRSLVDSEKLVLPKAKLYYTKKGEKKIVVSKILTK